MVRGMGVAVITRRCGVTPLRPWLRRWSRCSTPKRCCSSTTTRPRSKNSTPSWMRVWVPTTMSAWPDTMSSSARFLADWLMEPVSTTTVAGTAASLSSCVRARACWTANTSVGASSAHCLPASTTCSMASSDTMVLPDPTSPCRRRLMGVAVLRSASISESTSTWPSVSANDSRESSEVRYPSANGGQVGATRAATSALRSAMTSAKDSASLYFSRSIRGSTPRESGRCIPRTASSNDTSPSGTTSSGSGTGSVWLSTSLIAPRTRHEGTALVPG